MPDLPIGLRKTHHFRRAKGFLVKLDGLGSVLNDQIGCRRVISLGNRFGISHDVRLLHSVVVKGFWWKSESLPPAKGSIMRKVSSNCQRRKARAPGISEAD